MKSKEKIYSIACILIIVDQFIKLLVRSKMEISQEIVIIPKFFSLYYLENNGAAFSILGGEVVLLILISLIILYLLDRFITKEKISSKLSIISIGMIISGIVGNLVDRCLYGGVIDYLAFKIFNYNFPVFNIADICITIGSLILVIDIIKNEFKQKREKNK